jgi:hypothetical protein
MVISSAVSTKLKPPGRLGPISAPNGIHLTASVFFSGLSPRFPSDKFTTNVQVGTYVTCTLAYPIHRRLDNAADESKLSVD